MSVKSVSKMSVKYPKVKSDNKQRVYIVFYLNGKRYRLFNGSKINSNLCPNSYPVGKRFEVAKSAVKINGTYQNVNKLISESPLELWNIVNHPIKHKREFIGKPEFLKLKRIIEDKYPDLYKKHSQKHAIKCQKKNN